MKTHHASCVTFENSGLLILGSSGSGKSSLAIEMIAIGAKLVADDRCILKTQDDQLFATCPVPLIGKIEAHGIGILTAPTQPITVIRLAVDLDTQEPDRLPPHRTITLLGVEVDLVFGKDSPNLASALKLWLQGGRIA